MSGKKNKLLRKYLDKRNASEKIYLTKTKDRVVRHSIKEEIKESYKTANSNDKKVLTKFFKDDSNKK